MAHQLHFNEVEADDIQILLQDDNDNPLTNEEFQELYFKIGQKKIS